MQSTRRIIANNANRVLIFRMLRIPDCTELINVMIENCFRVSNLDWIGFFGKSWKKQVQCCFEDKKVIFLRNQYLNGEHLISFK